MTMIRRLLAVALLAAAAGCSGHKTDTTTTTSSSATTTSAPAVAGAAATAGPAVATLAPAAGGAMNGSTAGGGTVTGAGQPPGFASEADAQAHCTADQVVWLNTKSHVYHEKGALYYGHTKQGAYVCRKEADAAGDHDAKNGK